MGTTAINRLLEELEQLDAALRPGTDMADALAARQHLLAQMAALLASQPAAFDAAHLSRLRASWQRLESCRAAMAIYRSLLAAEYSRLHSEQQLHERISSSLCPDRSSWELAG